MVEERTIFVIKAIVKAPVQPQKEKASSAAACLSLNLPYLPSITAKPYLVGYTVTNFRNFRDVRKTLGSILLVSLI